MKSRGTSTFTRNGLTRLSQSSQYGGKDHEAEDDIYPVNMALEDLMAAGGMTGYMGV